MKTFLGTFALIAGLGFALAADPPQQTDSQKTTSAQTTSDSAAASGNVTFTNSSGTTYTVKQMAEQLQNLRAAIDQTLPMLAAFNENAKSSDGSIKSKVTGFLSGALNKETANNQNSNTWGGTLLSGLQKSLNKNSSTGFNPETVKNLGTLQTQLQPVSSTLQTLDVSPKSATSTSSEIANPSNTSTNQLTPTGRQK